MLKQILFAAGLTVAASAASASTMANISFGPSNAGGSGPLITFNGLAAPNTISGDATFTFTVNGDLDFVSEYVDILIDGFSLGRVFDNNSANDAFDFANDLGNQSQSNLTGSATISNAIMAGLIADGNLDLSFQFSQDVNFAGTVNTLFGDISYLPATPVPLPASLPLLLAGFGALGYFGRRRKTA